MNFFRYFFIVFLLFLPLQSSLSTHLSQASQSNQITVAIFLAPSCPWSALLSKTMSHPTFLGKMAKDTGLYTVSWEERDVHARYGIATYPTLLLLDPQGREFARLDDLALTPEQYAEKISLLIEDFASICSALDLVDTLVFDETFWRQIYEKSKHFSVSCYREMILQVGVEREEGAFFHLEQYASLLKTHKAKQPKMVAFKKKILERARPEEDLDFEIAFLEFQKLSSRSRAAKAYDVKALVPLLCYLKVGKKKKSRWRAEWLVAQALAEKKQTAAAERYLKAAYESAPEEFKTIIQSSAKR